MENISFTSKIRFMTRNDFNRAITAIDKRNYVKYPWTLEDSVLAPNAFTKDVYDCTTAAITDGQNVLLMHIDPKNSDNNLIDKAEKFIKEKIDLTSEYLQGFILGGKYSDSKNQSIINFEWFEDFMDRFKIPTSKFKGGAFMHDVAYISSKDEFIVGSSALNEDCSKTLKNPDKILPKIFDKFEISELDEVSW